MPSVHTAHTRELEAMVARAARLGRLDPFELLDLYVEIAPASHPEIGNARKLDLEAVTSALGSLPAAFVATPRVVLVPRLDAFTHEPVQSPAAPAGLLADGTLLLEGRFGESSLAGVAAALCALAYELHKARALLPGYEAVDECAGCTEADCHCEHAGEAALDEEADEAEGATELETEASAEEDASLLGEGLDPTSLALALGVDEQALRRADEESRGGLLTILEPGWDLPEIELHADFALPARARRAEAKSDKVVAVLAEMGLLGRPVHVWIGGPFLTDCLSPYTRELRDALCDWATSHPDRVGDDVPREGALGEDALYALASDFLASDARLGDERAQADRTVGIMRHEIDGLPFEVIDLGRADARVCDARLSPWPALTNAPVLVRVTPDLEDSGGFGVRALLAPLAASLASVTVALDGTGLGVAPGTVLVPDVLLRWSADGIVVPRSNPLGELDLGGAPLVTGGAALSLPHPALLSRARLAELGAGQALHALVVGGGGLLAALAEATYGGLLRPEVEVGWAVVATQFVARGRPSVDSVAGHTALALSQLRRIVAAAAPEPHRARSKPSSSGRTMRLKA